MTFVWMARCFLAPGATVFVTWTETQSPSAVRVGPALDAPPWAVDYLRGDLDRLPEFVDRRPLFLQSVPHRMVDFDFFMDAQLPPHLRHFSPNA